MKRYYYHVRYYVKGKDHSVGEGIINSTEPIKNAETINRIREAIKADGEDEDAAVVILGWQLLRIEDAEPEEVET